jgi:hypothetical protein
VAVLFRFVRGQGERIPGNFAPFSHKKDEYRRQEQKECGSSKHQPVAQGS